LILGWVSDGAAGLGCADGGGAVRAAVGVPDGGAVRRRAMPRRIARADRPVFLAAAVSSRVTSSSVSSPPPPSCPRRNAARRRVTLRAGDRDGWPLAGSPPASYRHQSHRFLMMPVLACRAPRRPLTGFSSGRSLLSALWIHGSAPRESSAQCRVAGLTSTSEKYIINLWTLLNCCTTSVGCIG
jgi:hypothetical protein